MVVALAAVLAACSGPTGSTAPSGPLEPSVPVASASPVGALPTVVPSIEPTPTAVPEPTEPGIQFDGRDEFSFVTRFVMRVAVDDLNARREPDKSSASNGKAKKGQLFMFYDWPVTADGYTWYYGFQQLENDDVVPNLPKSYNEGYDEILGGWMAAGTEDTPFLVPVGPRCPTTRDLRNVSAMLASERVACFGSDSLTLEGEFGCGDCGGEAPGTFEPAWLASPLEFYGLSVIGLGPDPDFDSGPLSLHFAPDGPAVPADGVIIRVNGHFSDARASTCRITVLASDGSLTRKIANSAAEQWCSSKFVVDSYEVIG
jgi:hypothetical protein